MNKGIPKWSMPPFAGAIKQRQGRVDSGFVSQLAQLLGSVLLQARG